MMTHFQMIDIVTSQMSQVQRDLVRLRPCVRRESVLHDLVHVRPEVPFRVVCAVRVLHQAETQSILNCQCMKHSIPGLVHHRLPPHNNTDCPNTSEKSAHHQKNETEKKPSSVSKNMTSILTQCLEKCTYLV